MADKTKLTVSKSKRTAGVPVIVDDAFYDDDELAVILNMSKRSVQRMEFPRVRVGKRLIRYRGRDVLAHLDAVSKQDAA